MNRKSDETARSTLDAAAQSSGDGSFGSRRICYVNFATHLLNAYNPNMSHPGLPYRWSDDDWFRFIDMIAWFGFNVFEFWLEPRLFCREAVDSEIGREFARQMSAVTEHAHRRGVKIELLAALTTVGDVWHTHCPRIPDEWREVLRLWDCWTRLLPRVDIIGIFPGDPGGCSRNGCTHETYIDGSAEVAELARRNIPSVEIELGTWGPPFFAWGIIKGPDGWQGEFVPQFQGTAWAFDKPRADAAMTCLLKRLPAFPPGTSVAINLGFNADGNPAGEQDARPWAREIAKTNCIYTWDYSLTEGENAIYPHYRFERLLARRREERAAAPYSGGICYTMTPLLNQLSLYASAASFANPDGDHAAVAGEFFAKLFGEAGRPLAQLLPLMEVVPDWGHYAKLDLPRSAFHAKMKETAELLRALDGRETAAIPFQPSLADYRRELLFFAELFADLSAPAPDYDALRARYWQRVYAIYDHLPRHVDPRPHAATDMLVRFFAEQYRG